jgi:sialic acid synthase SpsE
MISKEDKRIFENLFVLELANNHLGSVDRGLMIINDFSKVIRKNNIKAAIKLQLRDSNSFIHSSFKGNKSLRYISKTEATFLKNDNFKTLVQEIKKCGAIAMATPFDEPSVDLCEYFDFPIIKIASSDINDWPLIEKIASTRRPVIASTGGAYEKDLDDLVLFFKSRRIPLAINHCVSLYPCEDEQLCLDQIDYLKNKFPSNIIGFSTHEYNDWSSSMLISYAKGARTWERHIDIDFDEKIVSPYCSKPEQIDSWFQAFHKAVAMTGGVSNRRRVITPQESKYLDSLVRGVYAKRDIEVGYEILSNQFDTDFYLAIPLQKGQVSCREIINGTKVTQPIKKNQEVTIDYLDGPYKENNSLRSKIYNRGV